METNGKVLLKICDSVKFKKIIGTLSLTETFFLWHSEHAGGPKFNCLYSDIKVQRISPESSSKVQLQIVLQDDSSSNFQFVNASGRLAQLKDRNQVKDLLAHQIPAHRQKITKDLEEKNRILKENHELYQLYKDLVVGGIITAEEFWETHKQKDDSGKPWCKQDIGISSGFLAELKPDMHGCNELRFNLTADSIEAIFRMYPAVKKRYLETVPHEVTEKEFWTQFFQSQHFHRDRFSKSASSKDPFGDCAKKDELEQFDSLLAKFMDPLLDFSSPLPNLEDGYGGYRPKDNRSANEPLIKQFNQQSLMVLQNTVKRPSQSCAISDSSSDEGHRKRIRLAVEYSELHDEEDSAPPVLKILEVDKFSHTTSTLESSNGNMNGHRASGLGSKDFQTKLSQWIPSLQTVLSPEKASGVIASFGQGEKWAHEESGTTEDPGGAKDELKKAYIALCELLRHFWSCFPVVSPHLEEKVARMASCLEKFRDTRLINFQSSLTAGSEQLGAHLSDMIEAALSKFKSWQDRRTSTKNPRP